jgi:epoxide hydrolase-like predicted phosphatase
VAVRAVVVDVGGVLEVVDDVTWPDRLVAQWEDRQGLPRGTFQAAVTEGSDVSVTTGHVSEAQVRSMYRDALGLNDEQADQLMAEMWDAYCGELDVALRDFVAGLRPRFTTAILSNSGDGARREEQRRFGFEDFVDVVIYSHEVGLAKPDPAIYALTQERLGVSPTEVVFLDDKAANVEAAKHCGWHGILHRNTEDSVRILTEILVAAT